MLDFTTVLASAGVSSARTAMLRHQPREPSLRRVLPWLVVDRPELFMAYQQMQWTSAERLMARAELIAAFVGQEPGRATFAGLSRITGSRKLDFAGYHAFPGNAELMALGMTGMKADEPGPLAFDLEPMEQLRPLLGKLVVEWPKPERAWCRWADKSTFAVSAILEESRFARTMPHWRDLVLTWAELSALPRSWRSALAQWRGVYLIFDAARQRGYVGSAGGVENILGRWQDYAMSGHGGNARLRASQPRDLLFSILQRTSPDMEIPDLVLVEASWKRRLHTREHGLNEN